MIDGVDIYALGFFLLFCRIGGCLLVAPGLSSPRVPVHVRLFVALGVTLGMSPLVVPELLPKLNAMAADRKVYLIIWETMIGAVIGIMARCFLLALQFSATAISNFIGLSGIPGIPLEEVDTGSPLSTLVSTAAATMIFVLGLHMELPSAVLDSYNVLPLGSSFPVSAALSSFLVTLNETWLLALRLCGPFLLYGVIVNAALGIGNRFAQQISIYHASTGIVMLGGFLLFYILWNDWALLFVDAYRSWLLRGGF